MTKIIPRELIKHLEWSPPKKEKRKKRKTKTKRPTIIKSFSIDQLLEGRTFYSQEKNENDQYIGTAVAFEQALNYAGKKGIVLTMPELIKARIKAKDDHEYWGNWYCVHSEENIGIDKKGIFYKKDDPVLVVVHGGGILTPDRINTAIGEGLIDGSVKYTDQEFSKLLEGKLPDKSEIPLYNIEQITKGVDPLPHRFGVVMPYALAQETNSGYYKKDAFLENPLVIARNGGKSNLEAYFDRASDLDGDLGNNHPFNGRDASTPQGRVLFLYSRYDGLVGSNNLSSYGWFVGVRKNA